MITEVDRAAETIGMGYTVRETAALAMAGWILEMCRNRTEEIWKDGETQMEKVLYVKLSDIESLFEEEGK